MRAVLELFLTGNVVMVWQKAVALERLNLQYVRSKQLQFE